LKEASILDGRKLRSVQTKEKLLVAAKKIFLKDGFEKATVTQIITEADTGYGTAYVHFKGKEDFLSVLMEEIMVEFLKVAEMPFSPATREEAFKQITHQTSTFLYMAEKERALLQVIEEGIRLSKQISYKWDTIRETFISHITNDIKYSQAQNLARKEVNAMLVAKSWFYAHEMFLWEIVKTNQGMNVDDITQSLTTIYTNGLYI
jgi:AcrR family transcriptional regulator